MKSLTIQIPDALDATLAAAAVRRRQTKAGLVRRLIESSLPSAVHGKPAQPSVHDRLKKYQSAGPTGVKDLASHPAHLTGYGRE